MVKLNAKQVFNDGKQITPVMFTHPPVMFTHPLKSHHFGSDKVINCYITEMDHGKYAVFATGYKHSFYKVVPSLNVLNDDFNEI